MEESSDEEEIYLSDNDSETTDIISCPETAESFTLESDFAFVDDPRTRQGLVLGSIPSQSRSNLFSQGADWALLELRPTDLVMNSITLGDRLVDACRITERFPNRELLAVVSLRDPVWTTASPSVCGLFIPHSALLLLGPN
jgi:hypothetical protein